MKYLHFRIITRFGTQMHCIEIRSLPTALKGVTTQFNAGAVGTYNSVWCGAVGTHNSVWCGAVDTIIVYGVVRLAPLTMRAASLAAIIYPSSHRQHS